MKTKSILFLTFACLAAVIAAQAAETGTRPAVEQTQQAKATFGRWGVDLSGMNRNEKPGDDFFRYANGNWYDKAAIPADRTSTGSFVDLQIQSEDQVRAIVTGLESQPVRPLTADEQRVRDLYHSYVDTKRLEQLGLAPAKPVLDQIAALRTPEDVARAMGSAHMGTKSLFRTNIGVDDKNPDSYAVFLGQAGLGLPDRDYYLLNDRAITAARDAYRSYIAKIFELAELSGGDEKAAAILNLETEIAKLHWARAERRNAEKVYNPMTVAELEQMAPEFPWRVFLTADEIPGASDGTRRVVVGENTAFPPLAALFARTPVETWRDYLTFHYLSDHASYLPKRFDEARFEFGRVLGGQKEQLAREKRGVLFLDGIMGQGVGQLYVARYFSPDAKAKAQELVSNLLRIYRQRIDAADWMSPETRRDALQKLAKLNVKIGYPDKWRDYSKFRVDPDDLLGNDERGGEFEWNRRLARLDQPVDRSEWGMSPQTVNAYYNSSLNEIVFPAAILQPPFFDPHADDAVNYGGIGAVIGHEISHGFDDQGSKYDASGALKNWWTAEDRKNFDARTTALAKQFDGYAPLPNLFVNGQLTLGENIADLAGLTVAQAAYHLSLNGKPAPILDGFTGDQRFFLGFAQVWRYKAQDETTRQRLLSDPHSPPQFRVIGPARNMDAWYSAFDVKPGDAMYLDPELRIHLW